MILFVEITAIELELRVRGTLTAPGKVRPGTFDVRVGEEAFHDLSIVEPHVNANTRQRVLSIRLGPEAFHLEDHLAPLPCHLSFLASRKPTDDLTTGAETFEMTAASVWGYLTLVGTVLEQPEGAAPQRIVLAHRNGGQDGLPPDVGPRVLRDGRWPEGVFPPAQAGVSFGEVDRLLASSAGEGEPIPLQFTGGEHGQLRLVGRRAAITLPGTASFAASCRPLIRSGRPFLLPVGCGLRPASANGADTDAALPELVAVAV